MGHGMMMGRSASGGEPGDILSWLSNSFLVNLLLVLVIIWLLLTLASVVLNRLKQADRPVAKPSKTKCYHCGLDVTGEFRFCPRCSVSLLTKCATCNRTVHRTWGYCPHCSTKIKNE